PLRQEGFLLKKRKWPLKGWHKVGGRGQSVPSPGGISAPGGGGCRDQPLSLWRSPLSVPRGILCWKTAS
ncbi:39S ribosomal protein L10, mitochondrial, partial [Anas platyrhynchos]